MPRKLQESSAGLLEFTEEVFDTDGDNIFLNYVKLNSVNGAPPANATPSWFTFSTTQEVDAGGTRRRYVTVKIDPVGLEADTTYQFVFSAEDSTNPEVLHYVDVVVGLVPDNLISVAHGGNNANVVLTELLDTSINKTVKFNDSDSFAEDITFAAEAGYFFFFSNNQSQKIRRTDEDGSNKITVIDSPEYTGGPVLVRDNKIYWAANYVSALRRADLDGNNMEDIVNLGSAWEYPTEYDIDPINQIFFSSRAALKTVPFGGTSYNTIFAPPGTGYPTSKLVVDPFAKLIFIAVNRGPDVGTYRMNYDGSDKVKWFEGAAINGGLNHHFPFAIDPQAQKVYMREESSDFIRRFSYSGTNEFNYGAINNFFSPQGVYE